jgi:uncharacterized membrane protein YheB (UPF0754 family)
VSKQAKNVEAKQPIDSKSIVENLIQNTKGEVLGTIAELQETKLQAEGQTKHVIETFCDREYEQFVTRLTQIIDQNGSYIMLGKLLQDFYTSGDYKNLYTVWFLATKKEYRPAIAKVVSGLLVTERLIAKAIEKEQSQKRA